MNAVVGMIKLALEAGKATPAPPVGPALGAKGVNIMVFCWRYNTTCPAPVRPSFCNAKTSQKAGYIIPVELEVGDGSDMWGPSVSECEREIKVGTT